MSAVTVPLPKQGRGGDLRNAPHPPIPALSHIANLPVSEFTPPESHDWAWPEGEDVA